MIVASRVQAQSRAARGRAPAFVRDVTLEHARGVLAIVGARVDGTSLLLALLAGLARPRRGQVTIGGAPAAAARAKVAHVPMELSLPEPLRVDEVCDLAARIRRDEPRAANQVLAPLGLEALARRNVRSLTAAEARGVALANAVASSAPVLLVEEPFGGLEPPAVARVTEALRARAESGAAVVVTTASVRDATRLGDRIAVMTQGVLSPISVGYAHVGHDGARLRVVVASSDPGALVAALASDPAVASVETAAFARPPGRPESTSGAASALGVVVAGADLLALARAVNRAAAEARVDVEAIEPDVVPLDAIRAALRGAPS